MLERRATTIDAPATRGGRLRAVLQRDGVGGVVARVPRKIAASFVALWRRVFQHRNHVYRHDATGLHCSAIDELVVLRYENEAALTPELRKELASQVGDRRVVGDLWEMRRGAVLWIGRIDGRVAALSMTRRGDRFRRWLVPLQANDIVIFRNLTLPEFRGRGLCPALMNALIQTECRDGARAHVDCRVFNHASIRSIEKAGFTRIATCRPLTNEQVLD